MATKVIQSEIDEKNLASYEGFYVDFDGHLLSGINAVAEPVTLLWDGETWERKDLYELRTASPGFLKWREFVMSIGVGLLLICGGIVGHLYFNRVLHEIFEERK